MTTGTKTLSEEIAQEVKDAELAVERAKRLPLPYGEKTQVTVELWSWDRKTMLALVCTVSHHLGAIDYITIPDGWPVTARAVGLSNSEDTLGHIHTLAEQAFRRGGR